MNNEIISAFAYNVGKKIEELIIKETDDLVKTNKLLEGKILMYSGKLRGTPEGEKYDTFFDIKTMKKE